MILLRSFYQHDTLLVARALIGKYLIHETSQGITGGKIVETEAYIGPEDKASHAYNNLRSQRTETQFGPKGHAYIYLIYGMYHCFNVTSGDTPGKPEEVLVRALEPICGFELMSSRRHISLEAKTRMTNGPGKLCQALGISTKQNGDDMFSKPLYIDEGERVESEEIAEGKRINVDYANEWKHKPWRFYLRDNIFVSKHA